MLKITLCYIVKNEKSQLIRSIESAKGGYDELVVVDTGSTDGSENVAASYGGESAFFTWCDDFAAARNFALTKCCGDWVLFLDADEYFSDGGAAFVRPAVERAEQAGIKALLLAIDNIDNGVVQSQFYNLRLFRREKNFRYEGRIHEQLRDNGQEIDSVAYIPVEKCRLLHTGYMGCLSPQKAARNLRLLQEEMKTTKQPERLYGFLADAYLGVNDLDEAARYAWLDIQQGRRAVTYASRSWRILLQLLMAHDVNGISRIEVAKSAVANFPELPEFHAEYAECLAAAGRYEEAVQEVAALQTVQTGIEPSMFTEAMRSQLFKRAEVWKQQASGSLAVYQKSWKLWKEKRLGEAEEILQNAWQKTGVKSLRGMLLMAYIMRDQKQYLSEVACLQELLTTFAVAEEKKLLADAWSMLGEVLRIIGEAELAVDAFQKSVELEPCLEQQLVECSNAIFAANAVEKATPDLFAGLYGQYRNLLKKLVRQPYPQAAWKHQKIRVGYLSMDFRNHAVGQFVKPLLRDFDGEHFAVYVYSLTEQEDNVTIALQDSKAVWRKVCGRSWKQIAEQVRADEIDILVDLAGHTAGNALPVFAWQPAPVQISGIGYFNSTGIEETTGFLSDMFCAPGAVDSYFVEPLLRLPHSHFCYQPFTVFPDVGDLPCLQRGYVTFGCFNNFAKVTDEMLLVWKEILAQVPNSRLLLKHSLFDSSEGLDYTKKRMQRLGLPLAQIDFRGFSRDYLEQYREVDIALDTSPYPGGATTCEALYMGVPVVTLVGNRHGARFGYSFLSSIGLAELVAKDLVQYQQIAAGLAADKDLLQALHAGLRKRMEESLLMDAKGYMRGLERVYCQLSDVYPLVSIMIPTYNRPVFLEQTLQSCLNQDYPNLEIIVCDNSTNDDTAAVVARYTKDCRLRYYRNREAKTKEENFIPFERLARGEYLQWLMDDDMLAPYKISKMMKVFQRHQQVTMVTSQRGVVDVNGRLIDQRKAPFEINGEYKVIPAQEAALDVLTRAENWLGEPSAVLFRRKDLTHHYWRAECKGLLTISDVAMWLELLEKGDCAVFREPLSFYRKHPQQEGADPDVILLSRIEWVKLAQEYYRRQVFVYPRESYQRLTAILLEDCYRLEKLLKPVASEEMWSRYRQCMDSLAEKTIHVE